MSKAEDYIKKRTRGKVNHITENFPWISTNEALEAVKIAREDVLDVIEKELTQRMLKNYNEGAEEDDIAQGCMASLIMFVRQMKEE